MNFLLAGRGEVSFLIACKIWNKFKHTNWENAENKFLNLTQIKDVRPGLELNLYGCELD